MTGPGFRLNVSSWRHAGQTTLKVGAAGLLAAMLGHSAASAQTTDISGLWSPDQGVNWSIGLKPGEVQKPPFTPEYVARYQKALAAAEAGKPLADPPAACLPPGVPRIMGSPFPIEIVQTKNTVFMLHEYMSQNRRIFLNGTEPKSIGIASYNGRSIGHWEGDTLVVETSELVENSVLDTTHIEHSDQLTVKERIRLLPSGKLEDQITLTDPKAFATPWTVTRTYTKKPGERILDYICEENNRNPVDAEGNTGFVGPQ